MTNSYRIGRKPRQLRTNERQLRRFPRQQPLRGTLEGHTSQAGIPRAREIWMDTTLATRATLWDFQRTNPRRAKNPEVLRIIDVPGQILRWGAVSDVRVLPLKRLKRPVCTASRPSVTEEKSELDIKISIGCTSRVPGSVTTTNVLATIDMPGYKGVNMSAIDEFD